MVERATETAHKIGNAAKIAGEILRLPYTVPRSMREGDWVNQLVGGVEQVFWIGLPLVLAAAVISESGDPIEGIKMATFTWGVEIFGISLAVAP